jgi:hypothetical protein
MRMNQIEKDARTLLKGVTIQSETPKMSGPVWAKIDRNRKLMGLV